MSENAEQEPSMEEILASIRKIISDDEEDEAPEQAAEPAFEEEDEPEDVLELTDMVEEEPEPEPEPEPEVVAAVEPEPMPEPVIETMPPLDPDPVPSTEDGLISAGAATAAAGAFSALSSRKVEERVGDNTILGADTLAGLTQQMLRPMLKEWLDQHLPPLVERLVKQEIERLSRNG